MVAPWTNPYMNPIVRTAINGASARLYRGCPVIRKPEQTEPATVRFPFEGAALGEFGGILQDEILNNSMGDKHNSARVIAGEVKANIYVSTASNYTVGQYLYPIYDSTKARSYLTRVAFVTGIKLLEDLTSKSDGDYLNEDEGNGAWVEIEEGATYFSGLLHYAWRSPALGSGITVEAAITGSSSATTTVTDIDTGTLSPARNLVITPGGTTADVAAGDVVVTGTDVNGNTITESFTFTANQSTAVTGNKAFATVTKIVVHQQDGAAATFTTTAGDKLGLGRKFAAAPIVLQTRLGGTVEGTAPTLAVSATNLANNTILLNSALDGSAVDTLLAA